MRKMYNSIDTNIVIGILNPKDRLHSSAIKLVEKVLGSWIIAKQVITETKETLKKKINKIILDILPKLIEIYNNTYDLKNIIEIKSKLIRFFRQLKENNPNLKNFYELIYAKMDAYITEKNSLDIDIFSYLSELGENMSRIVEFELKKYINYKKIWIDFTQEYQKNLLKKIKIAIASIRFKDDYDENIFYELIVNIEKYNPLEFFTDDDEFLKKSNKAYNLLANLKNFKTDWFLAKKFQ